MLIGLCSYKNVLAIWSLFFCFDRHFELSRGLPLYTCSQTPVPGSPFSPFPVPRSPFRVLVTSNRGHLTKLFYKFSVKCIVSYAAVLCLVTQRSSNAGCKNLIDNYARLQSSQSSRLNFSAVAWVVVELAVFTLRCQT